MLDLLFITTLVLALVCCSWLLRRLAQARRDLTALVDALAAVMGRHTLLSFCESRCKALPPGVLRALRKEARP